MSLQNEIYRVEKTKWDDIARQATDIANIGPYRDFIDYASRASTMTGIADFLDPLADKQVLEIGCGLGQLTTLLAMSGAKVTAFDLSPQSVDVAQQRVTLNSMTEHVNLAVAAGEILPFPSESFDVVFGKGVLHHLNAEYGAPEILRVLKSGGKAAFSEPMGTNPLLSFVRAYIPYPHKHPRGADRPLTYDAIHRWGANYKVFNYREIQFLSMLERGLRKRRPLTVLRRLDGVLLEHFPFLRRFCRYVVLTMVK
ncbi:MAG TPA: class I SAM-dependent methyltransferase [Aggregatilineaceae bacterium]|nr:class I SAM-dependent methyltransferase [Aggregatilineaceae bacterium]